MEPSHEKQGTDVLDTVASNGVPVPEEAQTKPKDFRDVYKEFFLSVVDVKEKDFNQFIHPEKGLYIIESTGAMPQMVNIRDISTFKRANDNKPFFDFDKTKVGIELIEKDIPSVDCDAPPEFYTKSGSFTQEINKFKDSRIWEYAGLPKAEQKKIEELAETIVKTTVNTGNYTYYFSLINNKWHITFIDMRKPCVA